MKTGTQMARTSVAAAVRGSGFGRRHSHVPDSYREPGRNVPRDSSRQIDWSVRDSCHPKAYPDSVNAAGKMRNTKLDSALADHAGCGGAHDVRFELLLADVMAQANLPPKVPSTSSTSGSFRSMLLWEERGRDTFEGTSMPLVTPADET